jgi:hypothetical protein
MISHLYQPLIANCTSTVTSHISVSRICLYTPEGHSLNRSTRIHCRLCQLCNCTPQLCF